MRAALWLLGLFAVSVALALFAGNNQASVTLFWPPYRVDLSLNFVILALALGFVVLHLALRALRGLLSMPAEARRWRALQRERAMYAGLLESIVLFSAGRFTRARKAAVLAAEKAASLRGTDNEPVYRQRVEVLAHLYASESAHSLQDPTRRDEHWQRAMSLSQGKDMQDLREAALMRSARWLIDSRDAEGGLARLTELPQGAARRTLALRLKLRAARLAHETRLALDTARLLAKHKAFSPEASASILRGLIHDLLASAHDGEQLARAWKLVDERERQLPDLALQAAHRFATLPVRPNDTQPMNHWLEQARACLLPVWEQYPQLDTAQRHRLARVMEHAQVGLSREWLTRVENAQRATPNDALLQYISAHACADQQLWGKALQLFRQSAPDLRDPYLCRRAWLAVARLAQDKKDDTLHRQALEQAARVGE